MLRVGCTEFQFQCTDNTCIPQESLCNGVSDCATEEDEANCSSKLPRVTSSILGPCGIQITNSFSYPDTHLLPHLYPDFILTLVYIYSSGIYI